MALDQVLALINEDGVGVFQPGFDDGFDGVAAAAEIVLDLLFGQWGFAFVGDLPAFAAGVDLNDVAVFGVLDAVVVWPGVELPVFSGGFGGFAVVEGGGTALVDAVFLMEPGVATEGFDHCVEDGMGLLG